MMTSRIVESLTALAGEETVRIVYACESGSRAWGFPSADSDFDVRFLYLHPPDWYLAVDLEQKRDVIDHPINDQLDLSGWDLRKALRLFRKSNPPLLEWLGSPLVYWEQYSIAARMRWLAETYYSPKACMYHYLHMARGNYREFLKGERVWVKKYFYVLRPLLAINWLEQGLGMAPTAFETLVAGTVTNTSLKQEIEVLVAAKEAGQELDYGPRRPILSDFIEMEMARLETADFNRHSPHFPVEPLNQLFREALQEVWSS